MNPRVMAIFVLCALACPTVSGQTAGLRSPAGAGSAQASLAVGPDGRVFLSWIEPAGEQRHALKFSVLGDSSWSAPHTIAEGSNWFVNWADFPALTILPGGSMAAHWLERSGPDTYAYDVRIVRSSDAGATWSAPVTPHRDSTQTEHGFVSVFPAPDGSLGAVWLDGREMTGGEEGHGHGNMTLRYATIGGTGGASGEVILDNMVCECCQTSAAITARGPVVVYRDRLEGEIRDISVVRLVDGAWTTPQSVAPQGRMEDRRLSGERPAIAAMDRAVAVARFTAAGDTRGSNWLFRPTTDRALAADHRRRRIAVRQGRRGPPRGRERRRNWLERVAGAAALRAGASRPAGSWRRR